MNKEPYIPPAYVARNAQRALEVRASKPPSQQGMTLVGLARANQLASRRPVSLDTIRRMVAYFDRHEIDKRGSTWSSQGRGWQAWYGWGGDEGRDWANRILRQVEEVKIMEEKQFIVAMRDGMFYIYQNAEDTEPVIEDSVENFLDTLVRMMGYSREETEDLVEEATEEEMVQQEAPAMEEEAQKVEMTAEQRDALPDADFAVPQTRNFPVATPSDISDAVSSWGRYRGDVSFEVFKRNLIAIARRKGREFVDALPQSWKDEMEEEVKRVARTILSRMS